MKIGYLIQAFKEHETLKFLVNILLKDVFAEVFIHLDKKSDINLFYIDDKRVHFIEKREFVSWGGFSQTKLLFNLVEYVLAYPIKFDYYCFLTESCYPVYSGEQLKEKISESKNIILSATINQKRKIERYWFFDFHVKNLFIHKALSSTINKVSKILYNLKLLRKKPYTYVDGRKAQVFSSSSYFRLSFDEMKYVWRVYKNNSELRKYFKHSFVSQELIIATILGNSKFISDCIIREKYTCYADLCAMHYLRYVGPNVNVLLETDYDEIIESGKPFIRKIQVENPSSAKLIEKLEARKESNRIT